MRMQPDLILRRKKVNVGVLPSWKKKITELEVRFSSYIF